MSESKSETQRARQRSRTREFALSPTRCAAPNTTEDSSAAANHVDANASRIDLEAHEQATIISDNNFSKHDQQNCRHRKQNQPHQQQHH